MDAENVITDVIPDVGEDLYQTIGSSANTSLEESILNHSSHFRQLKAELDDFEMLERKVINNNESLEGDSDLWRKLKQMNASERELASPAKPQLPKYESSFNMDTLESTMNLTDTLPGHSDFVNPMTQSFDDFSRAHDIIKQERLPSGQSLGNGIQELTSEKIDELEDLDGVFATSPSKKGTSNNDFGILTQNSWNDTGDLSMNSNWDHYSDEEDDVINNNNGIASPAQPPVPLSSWNSNGTSPNPNTNASTLTPSSFQQSPVNDYSSSSPSHISPPDVPVQKDQFVEDEAPTSNLVKQMFSKKKEIEEPTSASSTNSNNKKGGLQLLKRRGPLRRGRSALGSARRPPMPSANSNEPTTAPPGRNETRKSLSSTQQTRKSSSTIRRPNTTSSTSGNDSNRRLSSTQRSTLPRRPLSSKNDYDNCQEDNNEDYYDDEQDVQSPQIMQKMKSLEAEKVTFERQKKQFKKLEQENENLKRELRNSQVDSNDKYSTLEAEFLSYKKDTEARIQREKRVAARQAKANQAPTRAERIEIEALKNQVTKLKLDSQNGESKWKAIVERQKTQLKILKQEIKEQKEQLVKHEEDRVRRFEEIRRKDDEIESLKRKITNLIKAEQKQQQQQQQQQHRRSITRSSPMNSNNSNNTPYQSQNHHHDYEEQQQQQSSHQNISSNSHRHPSRRPPSSSGLDSDRSQYDNPINNFTKNVGFTPNEYDETNNSQFVEEEEEEDNSYQNSQHTNNDLPILSESAAHRPALDSQFENEGFESDFEDDEFECVPEVRVEKMTAEIQELGLDDQSQYRNNSSNARINEEHGIEEQFPDLRKFDPSESKEWLNGSMDDGQVQQIQEEDTTTYSHNLAAVSMVDSMPKTGISVNSASNNQYVDLPMHNESPNNSRKPISEEPTESKSSKNDIRPQLTSTLCDEYVTIEGEGFVPPPTDVEKRMEEESIKNAVPSSFSGASLANLEDIPEEIGHTRSIGDGKSETVYPSGRTVVNFRNGTQKENFPDGSTVVRFQNGDVKRVLPKSHKGGDVVVYHYQQASTTQTTFEATGTQLFEFADGQREEHCTNGMKRISFPDGATELIFPNDRKHSTFPNGLLVMEHQGGRQVFARVDG